MHPAVIEWYLWRGLGEATGVYTNARMDSRSNRLGRSQSKHVIIWLVTIIGQVPAILYLISALKRCQTICGTSAHFFLPFSALIFILD
jgi:hypothetical protein